MELPTVASVEGNYVGVGVGFTPDYAGSDDYTAGDVPMFRYGLGNNRYVELLANTLNVNVLDSDNWRFGPAVTYNLGRTDVEDEAVDRMKDIDGTLQPGLFLTYTQILDNNPRNRFAIGADIFHDVSDESGTSGSVSARYWDQVSKAFDVGIAGGVQYGSTDYADTFFGIDNENAARSGLDQYDAEGGINSFQITPMVVMHLSESWHVGAGVRWKQLVGDAANSPIVEDRGDETQIIGGIGVAYSWGGQVNTK